MIFSADNCGKTCTLKLACQVFDHSFGLGSSIYGAAVLHALSCADAHLWVQAGVPVTLFYSRLPWQRDFTCFSANDFGLFLSDEDPKKGIWLEAGKALDYYMLRNGVSIHPTFFQLVPALPRTSRVPMLERCCRCLPCCRASRLGIPEETGAVGVVVGHGPVPLLRAVLCCAHRTPWSTRRSSGP